MLGGLWLAVDPAGSVVQLLQARPLDAVGSPADDAEGVASWVSDDALITLAQATSGKRPVADDDAFAGRWASIFTADKTLAGNAGSPVLYLMVMARLLSGTSRTLVSIDTSATTTKPAFELILEEDIR